MFMITLQNAVIDLTYTKYIPIENIWTILERIMYISKQTE